MSHDTHAATCPPGQESTHHVTSPATFVKVFALLFVLMCLTIGAAIYAHEAHIDAPWFTWAMNIVAMAIACIKATYVVLYFMGVKYATQLSKVFALGGFVWVTLLLIMFCDYGTRHDETSPGWTTENKSYQSNVNLPELGKEAPRQYWGAR
ncbi:MAG: cytochrome C oxidase subunit IV family protein [Armatimonadetes bacterium]|nr:cytochrome C oxidase subunit IV family protein [Armatimonadota bacterium]